MIHIIQARIRESVAVKERLLADDALLHTVERLAGAVTNVICSGGRILLCGNGGSASDSLHVAGELVGRFQREREAWSAIVLNADVATMTAIANDYGYDNVFSRQVAGHMRPGDLLIGFSTSGNSENICKAVEKAREMGGLSAAFIGGSGGRLREIADFSVVIPSTVTARIQESHIMLGHVLCELAEVSLTDGRFHE